MERNRMFIDKEEVMFLTNLSGSNIDRLERSGCFPRRRQLSPRRVAWLYSEILDWIAHKLSSTGT